MLLFEMEKKIFKNVKLGLISVLHVQNLQMNNVDTVP